jgi:molybdopterin-binding protein
MQRHLAPREAASILGIGYGTLTQWISKKKIKTTKTPGGHHRIPESEINRFIPERLEREGLSVDRGNFRKISGRNQLICVILALKVDGLLAQVTLAVGTQHVASIITADAARELRLKVGERVAILFKSTEVMILRV